MQGLWIISPIAKNSKFDHFLFHAFAQNFPNYIGHNSLNFHHLRVIFDFLESPRCPLQSLFFSFLHLKNLYWCKLPWQSVFLLTYEMTYNALAHISQMKHFLDTILERKRCRKLNFLQNEFWLGKNGWSMWKLCLVKVWLTSPIETLIRSFWLLMN